VTAAIGPFTGGAAGRSWLHRASPIPKLAWLATTVVVVLVTFVPGLLVAIIAAGIVLAASSGTGRVTARTVIALAPVAASIVVIQSLAPAACRPDCTPAAALGPLTVYQEGLGRALVLVARLVAMEVVAVPLLATTHPSDLFAALRRLRLPYEIALMLSLSLQLVPQLRRELDEVLAAQRARGFRGRGLAALAPALVPVVAGAFDRLTTMVLGLEARGLGAGRTRTSYRRVSLGPTGVVSSLLALVAAVAGIGRSITAGPQGTLGLDVPPGVAVAVVVVALAVFVLVLARAARALGGR